MTSNNIDIYQYKYLKYKSKFYKSKNGGTKDNDSFLNRGKKALSKAFTSVVKSIQESIKSKDPKKPIKSDETLTSKENSKPQSKIYSELFDFINNLIVTGTWQDGNTHTQKFSNFFENKYNMGMKKISESLSKFQTNYHLYYSYTFIPHNDHLSNLSVVDKKKIIIDFNHITTKLSEFLNSDNFKIQITYINDIQKIDKPDETNLILLYDSSKKLWSINGNEHNKLFILIYKLKINNDLISPIYEK